MDVDERQDESKELMEMSAEENSGKSSPAEHNTQCSPYGPSTLESRVFSLSPIKFEDEGSFDDVSQASGSEGDDPKSTPKNGFGHPKAVSEDEEEFEASSDVSFLKDKSQMASPSRNFKSSYAKSLADSYRRASLPVVVAAPKGQFYFKNDEFIPLNARHTRLSGFSQDKFTSLNASTTRSPSLPGFEPLSLPTILDVVPEPQENLQDRQESKLSSKNPQNEILRDEDVFVPYERLQKYCEEVGSHFSLQDWHSLGSLITSDGRKLVKLSDFQERMRSYKLPKSVSNGHATENGCLKDVQVDGLQLERGQLEGQIEQLCEVMAHRDNTVQRLEEDLLRIRMECQRLMVENRALRSNLGQSTSSLNSDSPTQVGKLEQQVQLLKAQLNRAERSRHTYEAATRQLVEFLHTVNSTLGTANSTSSSTSSTPPVTHGVQTDDELESDPPYRLAQSHNASAEMRARSVSHTFGPMRRNSDAIRRAGSVCALPTQPVTTNRVSRAASTYCVATEVNRSSQIEPVASGSTEKGSPGKSPTSEFLATRARELITSLKSLMRSESILKLNTEPKKSGSGAASGSSTSRSTKSESHSSIAGSSENNRTTIWHIPPEVDFDKKPRDDNQNIADGLCGTSDGSESVSQSLTDGKNINAALNNNNNSAPSSMRDERMQPVTVNINPQPLSLTVVGDPSSSSLDDHRFSSLPTRGRTARNLNDSEHRLVWV